MTSALRAIRIALRSLWRTPLVTVAAVICLALGLGATTSVFSAVNTALLGSLPFPEPDRLVSVFRTTPHFQNGPFAPANFLDLREQTKALESLGAINGNTALLTDGEGTVQVSAYQVSGDVLPLLGVEPLLGRLLQLSDDDEGQPPVAVISGEVFSSRFGDDPEAIGSQVILDGVSHTIVGVLPHDFRIPHRNRSITSDYWLPLRFSPERAARRRNNFLLLLGRLAPGRTVAEAEAELVGLMLGITELHPEVRGESVRVGSMQSEATGSLETPLLLMLGAVGLVLLVATANVASLILARGSQRRHEISLRTALGASRASIIRVVLTESAVLAGMGVGLGLLVALAGVGVIGALGADLYPQLGELGINLEVLGFAVLLTALVAVGCSVLPSLQVTRADPQEVLSSGGARTGSSRVSARFLRGLVISEVALSSVLLLGAGLLIKAFADLLDRPAGFDTERLLTMVVDVPPERYADSDPVRTFLLPALDQVRALPGVTEAGAITLIPYDNWGSNFNIRYEGVAPDDPTQLPLVESRPVTPSYFATLELEPIQGRLFSEADGLAESEDVLVVVNQALVRRDFPDGDVIGKRFHSGPSGFATIIGVVPDIRNSGPVNDPRPEVYWNMAGGWGGTRLPLLVRTTGDPATAAGPVLAALRNVDPQVAVSRVTTMPEVIARSVRRPRFFMLLLGSFAGVALALSLVGLYGVISYAVASRTREFGIRSALGATALRTVSMVLGSGMLLTLGGLAAGAAAGIGLTRMLEGMLYGVDPLHRGVWLVALASMAGTAALACLIPAWRAARINPMEAIRYE